MKRFLAVTLAVVILFGCAVSCADSLAVERNKGIKSFNEQILLNLIYFRTLYKSSPGLFTDEYAITAYHYYMAYKELSMASIMELINSNEYLSNGTMMESHSVIELSSVWNMSTLEKSFTGWLIGDVKREEFLDMLMIYIKAEIDK